MPKSIVYVVMFLWSVSLFSQTPADTGASKKNTTVITSTQALSTATSTNLTSTSASETNSTANPIRDSGSVKWDIAVEDSARSNPGKYLYGHYLFNNKKRDSTSIPCAILSLFVLLLIWYWGIKYTITSGLCRDVSYDKSGNVRNPKDSPFSFSRVQLVWWTMIILSCYVIFFGVTGVLLPLNLTSVGLLGIGAFVCGAGKIIDNRQIDNNAGNRSQDVQSGNHRPNLIRNILSDQNGVSVHRFQAVIFNLIFGIFFVAYFFQQLDILYPFADFTEWQFSLLGISSATYLGLKSAENRQTQNQGDSVTVNTNQPISGETPAPKAMNRF